MRERAGIQTSELLVEYETTGGTVIALSHPGLSVDTGTSVAIMGPSGCGKSTLLGVLSGLELPTRGRVTIGGTTVSDLSEADRTKFRRSDLGLVFQADNLLPHLTVEENVGLQLAIGRRATDADVDGDQRRTAQVLGRLGIGDLGRRLPDQLSGGQRQRAAIARAVVHRPLVMFADEPTGALDEANARGVVELLVDLQREDGTTLVLVTHDPVVAAHFDRTEHLTASVAPQPHDGGPTDAR